MQKKMTVWLITFQVGGVLTLFFFLRVAIRVGELAYTTLHHNSSSLYNIHSVHRYIEIILLHTLAVIIILHNTLH